MKKLILSSVICLVTLGVFAQTGNAITSMV